MRYVDKKEGKRSHKEKKDKEGGAEPGAKTFGLGASLPSRGSGKRRLGGGHQRNLAVVLHSSDRRRSRGGLKREK